MTMLDLRIQQHFIDSADLQYQAAEPLAKPVEAGVQALLACVTSGGKVLVAGWGGTAAAAPYFASLFVGGFERERPELAAWPNCCARPMCMCACPMTGQREFVKCNSWCCIVCVMGWMLNYWVNRS